MHKYWARVMWPEKKLRLQGGAREMRTRRGSRVECAWGMLVITLGATPPSLAARECGSLPLIARSSRPCSKDVSTKLQRLIVLASPQAMVGGSSVLLEMPHSYFFFWAFSAALVTLPVVTSLKFTLCNNRTLIQNTDIKKICRKRS